MKQCEVNFLSRGVTFFILGDVNLTDGFCKRRHESKHKKKQNKIDKKVKEIIRKIIPSVYICVYGRLQIDLHIIKCHQLITAFFIRVFKFIFSLLELSARIHTLYSMFMQQQQLQLAYYIQAVQYCCSNWILGVQNV